jgi:flavin reductase (DIM6/NTAB) family NADH-FMN oxidoreductase RutF
MTVSAFCSVSLTAAADPDLHREVGLGIPALTSAEGFAINILSAKREQIARRFAIIDIDRFEGVGFTRSSKGYAVLDDVLGVLECRRFQIHDGGDHTIILGEVEATRVEGGTPLLYYRGGYAQLEH